MTFRIRRCVIHRWMRLRWVTPRYVGETAYREYTPGRSLRHPSWKGFRDVAPAGSRVLNTVGTESRSKANAQLIIESVLESTAQAFDTHPARLDCAARSVRSVRSASQRSRDSTGRSAGQLAPSHVGVDKWSLCRPFTGTITRCASAGQLLSPSAGQHSNTTRRLAASNVLVIFALRCGCTCPTGAGSPLSQRRTRSRSPSSSRTQAY